MAFTVLQCADWIKLTMGGVPASPLSTLELVNMAGSHLTGMSKWRFMQRRSSYLSTVASQSYIALPADFGGLVSLVGVSLNVGDQPATFDEINRLRNSSPASIGGNPYMYVVSDTTPINGTPALRYLELHPTPTAATANAFSIVYRAIWANLTAEADYILIPDYCKTLFIRVLQAHARGLQREEQATLSARLAELAQSPEFIGAVRQDRAMQTDFGVLPSQLGYEGPYEPRKLYGTITGP